MKGQRRQLAALALICLGCATAKVALPPDELVPGPARTPAPPSPAGCPSTAPAATLAPGALLGRVVERVCLIGASEDARLKLFERVAPREGVVLTPEAVAEDLVALFATGLLRDARALALPAGERGALLVYVVAEENLIGRVDIAGASAPVEPLLRDLAPLGQRASVFELARMTAAMRELYARRGHAAARIEPHLEPLGPGEVRLSLTVEEGPVLTLGAVRFVGHRRVPEKELRAHLTTRPGAPWRGDASADELALVALYLDRGMVQATVSADVSEPTPDGRVDVSFSISEGDVFRVGTVTLAGHSLGDARKLLGQLETKPGVVLSRSALHRDLERLRLAAFKRGEKVDVTPISNVDLDARRVDLELQIEHLEGPVRF